VIRSIGIAAALVAVLAVAGCGGSDSSDSGGAYGGKGGAATKPTSANASGDAGGGAAVVSVASNPELGAIVVTAEGLTLYDFHKDKGTTSSCYGGCAGVWPPLTTEGTPQAKGGAMASKLGTTKRKDGTVQVTYAGHPLYTYTADTKPGDTKGNDIDSFGAEWYALTPAGSEPED
jgi:predicted lipoprotein with Yx(FWY)xxD motif